MTTQQEISSALETIKAVADAIKELGEVPNGHLYATLMGVMDLATYDKIIGILVRGKIIEKRGDLLVWSIT